MLRRYRPSGLTGLEMLELGYMLLCSMRGCFSLNGEMLLIYTTSNTLSDYMDYAESNHWVPAK